MILYIIIPTWAAYLCPYNMINCSWIVCVCCIHALNILIVVFFPPGNENIIKKEVDQKGRIST